MSERGDNKVEREDDRVSGLDSIAEFHAQIDRETAVTAGRLGDRISCRAGCADCCVDGLTVFGVEADRIRHDLGQRLEGAEPHPEGACVFLAADSTCRIYESRPYVCRTQGLPLRWLDERDGEVVEYRDICPLNDHGDPIETLSESDCWTIGPAEQRLVRIQRASGEDGAQRVALRSLFDELACRRYED